ncbi:hypothetical protein [Flindersiella endophytica]
MALWRDLDDRIALLPLAVREKVFEVVESLLVADDEQRDYLHGLLCAIALEPPVVHQVSTRTCLMALSDLAVEVQRWYAEHPAGQ